MWMSMLRAISSMLTAMRRHYWHPVVSSRWFHKEWYLQLNESLSNGVVVDMLGEKGDPTVDLVFPTIIGFKNCITGYTQFPKVSKVHAKYRSLICIVISGNWRNDALLNIWRRLAQKCKYKKEALGWFSFEWTLEDCTMKNHFLGYLVEYNRMHWNIFFMDASVYETFIVCIKTAWRGSFKKRASRIPEKRGLMERQGKGEQPKISAEVACTSSRMVLKRTSRCTVREKRSTATDQDGVLGWGCKWCCLCRERGRQEKNPKRDVNMCSKHGIEVLVSRLKRRPRIKIEPSLDMRPSVYIEKHLCSRRVHSASAEPHGSGKPYEWHTSIKEPGSACTSLWDVWTEKENAKYFFLRAGKGEERFVIWVAQVSLLLRLDTDTNSNEIEHVILQYMMSTPVLAEVDERLGRVRLRSGTTDRGKL